jgi:outer membrane lipoprotein-sorting protein
MVNVLSFALTLTLATSGLAAPPAPKVDNNNAKAIMEEVKKKASAKDEVATVKMTIVEKDGTKKDRTLEIRRKGGDGKQKVLVRLKAPADLKGTALLSVSKDKESDQWLYLPSSKQTRRVQSSKKSSGFLDSELSYEDMGSASDTKAESKVIKQAKENGHNYAVIESMLTGESSYGKVIVWVDTDTYLPSKTEIFDKALKPLKVTTLSDYQEFGGAWRAKKVEVKNLQNQRGTVLELSDLKLNRGLSDGEFTESALTEGD